jgi:very-short-patch-repair endonuclease
MWNEGGLREIAARQHGLVGREQALSMGATDTDIKRRLEVERVEQLHPGVYYLNATPATWKTDVLAAVMAAGPDALASHRCAAVLRCLDAVYGRLVEVTVPYEDSPTPSGVILHRSRRPNSKSMVDGIPTTSVERNLLDLSAILPQIAIEKAARSAIRDGLTDVRRLALELTVSGGRGVRGTKHYRAAINTVAYDQSDSVAEIDLKAIVEGASIPRPVQQLRVRTPSGNVYPDFAWVDRGRIVEVDGFETHRDPARFQRDLERQNQLMDLGWEIRRFTASDVRREPERVMAELIKFVNRPFQPFRGGPDSGLSDPSSVL